MNEITAYGELERMANAIAKSKLFNITTPEQALALMVVAASEGRAPGSVAKDYHIIQNRPALRADAMLARFQNAGGKVAWTTYTDEKVEATFTHPAGGSITIAWTFKQAERIGLTKKDNWRMYPRAMLRSRVIAEGVRTCFPAVIVGEYTVEEVQDFDATPPKQAWVQVDAPKLEDHSTDDMVTYKLFIPDNEGKPVIYKSCETKEEYIETYQKIIDKIRTSKLEDKAKQDKEALFDSMNIDLIRELIFGEENEQV